MRRKNQRIPWQSGSSAAWRSLEQLSVLWGLSRGRAGLAIQALVADGRMEVRVASRGESDYAEYRIVLR